MEAGHTRNAYAIILLLCLLAKHPYLHSEILNETMKVYPMLPSPFHLKCFNRKENPITKESLFLSVAVAEGAL